jgi:hypothetical protein
VRAQAPSTGLYQLRDRLVQAGLLTDEKASEYLAAFNSPDFLRIGPIFMAVWGKKPE